MAAVHALNCTKSLFTQAVAEIILPQAESAILNMALSWRRCSDWRSLPLQLHAVGSCAAV